MTAQKHTEGPWVFEDYSQEEVEFFVIPATYHGTVAKVFREEDARLIASAPEMLEALEAALFTHGDQYSWGPAARAAVLRARGHHA